MMARKLPYELGSRFWIPLREGGFARGLVARMNEKGVIFAYFFGPKVRDARDWDLAGPATPKDCVMRGQVGDLGLVKGEWLVESPPPGWTKEAWPMPPFVRQDSDGQILVTIYDDQIQYQAERVGSGADMESLPRDLLMGYGSAEIRLTKLLA
jgi:hypothetical protein